MNPTRERELTGRDMKKKKKSRIGVGAQMQRLGDQARKDQLTLFFASESAPLASSNAAASV